MNQRAYVACNFKCLIETEGLFKVTGSHVHVKVVMSWKRCKTDTLLLRYTACVIVAIPMTLSDLEGHAFTAGLLECNLSYTCAAVDKISTCIARCVVPL